MGKDGDEEKIQSFTDLNAWKEGPKLVLMIYKSTKKFPSEERFALVDQMRRAVISITSNIAEGFSRKSFKEKLQFYSMALGSITELQNQLFASRDIGYMAQNEFAEIMGQSVVVHKITNGLISFSKSVIHNT